MCLDDAFQIRQVLPAGLARVGFCCWARWARFFIEKNKCTSRYHTFLSIKGFSIGISQREWVDGGQWVWMMFI
jgi:hypothetical protein